MTTNTRIDPITANMLSFSSLLLLAAFLSLATAHSTVYDALKQHGLPMGLLPKGVKQFEIDADGNFQVRLDKPCTAKFENEVRYEANVSGTIGFGRIGALKGVSAQELFLWFPVKGIRVDIPNSGIIYFDVGVIYKQFSLSLFETPPDCHEAETEANLNGILREDEGFAEIVQKSTYGKLRNMVDNKANEMADI